MINLIPDLLLLLNEIRFTLSFIEEMIILMKYNRQDGFNRETVLFS